MHSDRKKRRFTLLFAIGDARRYDRVYLMSENVKIRVPLFMDDPILGRMIAFFPIPIFCDLIIIENKQLKYIGSKLSTKHNKSFDLTNIKKILLLKKKLTGLTKDYRLDPWGRIGTEVELFLVDINDKRQMLIPKFFINVHNMGQKKWDRFMNKLCKYSDLPLEESSEPTKSV